MMILPTCESLVIGKGVIATVRRVVVPLMLITLPDMSP